MAASSGHKRILLILSSPTSALLYLLDFHLDRMNAKGQRRHSYWGQGYLLQIGRRGVACATGKDMLSLG